MFIWPIFSVVGHFDRLNRLTLLFGILSGVPDVITYAKFYVNRLTGFSGAAPPNVSFPILIRTTLTTVLHYRADCANFSGPERINVTDD